MVSGGIQAPDVYFGGSSGPAGPVAARHADVYLTWGEPPELVREKITWMRDLAAAEGRTLRFGLRIHTLSRDTSEEAWRHAQWLLDGLDPATVANAQKALRASESTGQQRMLALREGRTTYSSARDLEVSPGLWTGVGLVRGGAGTALVGSHEEVADRLEEYHRLGIDEFILSGYPHVEEAYWFGEGVRPLLRQRGLLGDTAATPQVRASA
jgi:alkanesulfonate monooxygenase